MITQVNLAIISIVIIIPLTSFAVLASDSKMQEENINSKLTVISSFYPLQEFSEKVGQDKVDVKLLVPIGIEPHDWEPTIQDVQSIQNADLIIINGIGFENWLDDLDEINFKGTIVDTSVGITIRNSDESDHPNEFGDPHIWLNPVLAQIQVQNIANAFSNSDPENQEFYQQNAIKFKSELEELDAQIRNQLSNCNNNFIAFHDAFSYFADEYGLNQHTIISSNAPHAEPTAKTLENVINLARELNLKIIFTEETADARTSQVIADEIGGKVLVLSPIEIGNDQNYVSRMTENLANLKVALC